MDQDILEKHFSYHGLSSKYFEAIMIDPNTDANKYKPHIIHAILNPTIWLEIRYMKKTEINICFIYYSSQLSA